jgi:hypothetical protein
MSAMAVAPGIGRAGSVRDVRAVGRAGGAVRGRDAVPSGRAADGAPGELRLTARGRAVLVTVALVVAALGGLMGGRALAADDTSGSSAVVEHVVASGETLWDIAAETTPDGESVKGTVSRLVRLNGLSSDQVMAGQTIVVPQG